MLTPFGREVRRLRLDHEGGPKLKDLADALGVSSAYLSAVETGRKSAPPKLVERIADLFKVDDKKRNELLRLASASAKTVQLSLTGQGERRRELAVAFARRFSELSEEGIAKMLDVIEHEAASTKRQT